MRASRKLWVTPILAFAAACLSCSSQANTDTACTPGQSIQCSGTNGCVGAQVCAADGSAYAECLCGTGAAQGTGGVSANSTAKSGVYASGAGTATRATGGTSARGTSSSAATTGGRAGSSVGGVASTSTGGVASCAPADMTTASYPGYIPARSMPGSCTEQALSQYYTACFQGNDCAAFNQGGALESCGTCLAPTPLNAATYGPLLKVGEGTSYILETNVAGCEELLGEADCAPKIQTDLLCEVGACAHNCPLVDSSSYSPFFGCMNDALTGTCSSRHSAASCLKSTSNAAACGGSGFQDQFMAVARVFCG